MASFAEVARYNRMTPNVDLTKGGIYAIQPHVITPPAPIKVGYSANLLGRLAQYHQMYPYGYDILALGRTNTRDTNYVRVRDDALLAESDMLRNLHDFRAYGKEWMDGARLQEVLKALKEAHAKYTGKGPLGEKLYYGKDLHYLLTRPSSRRLTGKQTPPPPPAPPKRIIKKAPIEKPEEQVPRQPIKFEPLPPRVNTRRLGLSERELQRGVVLAGPFNLQKRTRRGGSY